MPQSTHPFTSSLESPTLCPESIWILDMHLTMRTTFSPSRCRQDITRLDGNDLYEPLQGILGAVPRHQTPIGDGSMEQGVE